MPLYPLFAVVTFLSAFLLFQVQPLISKHILPWFGGGAMVWITALFFFMLALLAGYLYVLVLSRLTFTVQKIAHSAVVLLVLSVLHVHHSAWLSAITPVFSESYFAAGPVWGILTVLLVSVGAPFFLLASTSSLLQLWYGTVTEKEPFSLYAISNVGSLLGLLSYPFLIEPLLSTTGQGQLWTGLFLLYVVGLVLVMLQSVRKEAPAAPTLSPAVLARELVTPFNFFRWMAVASVPVMIMLSSTSFITGFVAAMPFIWIVPLALYLISFIISFRSGERSISNLTLGFVVLVGVAALSLIPISNLVTVPALLLVLWAAVFVIAHYCHEWLYEHRPAPAELPWFYLALSFGGVLGSSVMLISSLFVLKSALEFLLVVFGTVLFALYQLYRRRESGVIFSGPLLYALTLVFVINIVAIVLVQHNRSEDTIALERNFFGTKRVMQGTNAEDGRLFRTLVHEQTTHGFEYLDNPELTGKPVAYYTETSGLGRLMTVKKAQSVGEGIDVAVIGLGAGLLSAFCRPEDRYTFFEIDPEVVTLTEEYFTYLSRCDQKEIKLGDARQLLSREQAEGEKQYDVIIMDAYADDAAPAHLLTAEAAAVYLSLLKPDGVIALHVSSRYINLLPVVAGLASTHNLAGRHHFDTDQPSYGFSSSWTLLAREADIFSEPELTVVKDLAEIPPVFWTDTKNALLPVVRFRN